MIAIIQTGGKQYKVSQGDTIKVEKLETAAGKTVKFEVLFIGDEESIKVGDPHVKAVVEGKVLGEVRSKKVTGIKHKAKKRELTRYGHRQTYTQVEITKVSA